MPYFDTTTRRGRFRRSKDRPLTQVRPGGALRLRPLPRPGGGRGARQHGAVTAERQNFGKMLLVFGCIGTNLCKKIRIFQQFLRSTRLSNRNFEILAKI